MPTNEITRRKEIDKKLFVLAVQIDDLDLISPFLSTTVNYSTETTLGIEIIDRHRLCFCTESIQRLVQDMQGIHDFLDLADLCRA